MIRQRVIQILWVLTNGLFFLSLLLVIYTGGWEYSTRKYLQGFSDAVVPSSATAEGKINAIMQWMENGPARRSEPATGALPERDPEETLNYRALLMVCGTATNAFVNLANSSGLPARRLLLLDESRRTTHVVAEVLVNRRWIVVDPTFHFIARNAQGEMLTRQQLADLAVFHQATAGIPDYRPEYDYDLTAHVRLGRVRVIGPALRRILSRVTPQWGESVYLTLLLERESFAALNFAVLLTLFLFLVRILLRWYAEARMGIHRVRMREQLLRAARVFLGGPA